MAKRCEGIFPLSSDVRLLVRKRMSCFWNHVLRHHIEAETEWRYREKKRSMYDVEHDHLFASIREGKPINNGDYMCKSTLMALMGRQASYTGQEILWEEYWNDETVLGPTEMEWAWGDYDVGKVPVPGRKA